MRTYYFFSSVLLELLFQLPGIDFNTSSVMSLPSTADTTELASKI